MHSNDAYSSDGYCNHMRHGRILTSGSPLAHPRYAEWARLQHGIGTHAAVACFHAADLDRSGCLNRHEFLLANEVGRSTNFALFIQCFRDSFCISLSVSVSGSVSVSLSPTHSPTHTYACTTQRQSGVLSPGPAREPARCRHSGRRDLSHVRGRRSGITWTR